MELEKILKDLVKIPSVTSDIDNCKRAVDYIKDLVIKEGLQTKIYKNKNAYTLLIAREIKSKYEVILNGHLDVVPAPLVQFEPKIEIEEGKRIMYGRGTSDMKGPDVSILLAFLESIKEGNNLDMALLFTTDEETGGFNGIKYILTQGISADIVFIPDGGQNWSICTAEKGVFQLQFNARGVSAHGSRVWLGDNALEKLIKVYRNIQRKFLKKWGKPTKRENWIPTINLGALNGGDAANKVPNEGEMLIDIRYPLPIKQEDIENIVKRSITKGVTWKPISTGAPLQTDLSSEYFKKWVSLINNPIFEKEPGASDGRFFAEKGINVILTKPICSNPHIDSEWVDVDDLIIFKDKVKLWLKSL
jgi:succinyl-diaminopimelate desuccinylase